MSHFKGFVRNLKLLIIVQEPLLSLNLSSSITIKLYLLDITCFFSGCWWRWSPIFFSDKEWPSSSHSPPSLKEPDSMFVTSAAAPKPPFNSRGLHCTITAQCTLLSKSLNIYTFAIKCQWTAKYLPFKPSFLGGVTPLSRWSDFGR